MKVQFAKETAPPSAHDVARFEESNEIHLPQLYREFLLQHNGGSPVPNRVRVPQWHGGHTALNNFLGIATGDHRDLQKTLDRFDDRIPKGFVAIARDPGGNLFCLGLAGQHEGAIYLWDHEDELDDDGDSKQDMSNMFKVADDIDDLLHNKLLSDS